MKELSKIFQTRIRQFWYSNRLNLFAQLAMSCAAGIFFSFLRRNTVRSPNDFGWAVSTAKALISGIDPYGGILRDTVPYPLPVAIFGLPFVWTDEITATDIFVGISISILVFGILINGKAWQLLILASAPLVFAVEVGQWSPLITASWFWPELAGVLTLVKPQTALPILLARFRWQSVVVGSFVLVISLFVMPLWPWKWWMLASGYKFYQMPVLAAFGMFLLLFLLYFSEAEARLLFFVSILPYRSIYDLASLALIPQNAWQMIIYVVLSWLYLFSIQLWGINITPFALHLLCLTFILITYPKKVWFFNLKKPHSAEKKDIP